LLTIICPECGHEMNGPDEAIGKTGRCKKCSARFRVTKEITRSGVSTETSKESGRVPGASIADRVTVVVFGIASLALAIAGIPFYDETALCLGLGIGAILAAALSLERFRSLPISRGREPGIVGMAAGWILVLFSIYHDIFLA